MIHFNITIQSGENTRWFADDTELQERVKTLVESAVKCWSDGQIPRVIISKEQPICDVCAARKRALS